VRTYILTRILSMLLVMVGVSVIAFVILHLTPGDPARIMLGQEARPEDVTALRATLGLDDPIPIQYARFVGRALRGDLGASLKYRQPVSVMISERLGTTILLALASLALSVSFAVPLGIIAALRRGTFADFTTMAIALVGVSAPTFWIALLLIFAFAYKLQILPAAGLPSFSTAGLAMLKHLLLPAMTLALVSGAIVARMTRSSMLEVLRQDYVRTARAKGLRLSQIIIKHGLRNALIPTVTIVGLQLGTLLGGAVVTETVFALPGIGRLAVEAIQSRDFPVVQGVVLIAACAVTLSNLLVDLAYGLLDPRITYS